MQELKNLLDSNKPANYKDIAQLLMSEYELTKPNSDNDNNDHKDSNESPVVSELLTATLKANLVGIGENYCASVLEYIMKARVITWQSGGSGISPETFIAFTESQSGMKYRLDIPKNNGFSDNTLIPASHLLDQFLRHCDYYTELPDTDINAFITGDFIQLGHAASLIEKLDNIWLGFCFNSAHTATISNSTLNKTTAILEQPDSAVFSDMSELIHFMNMNDDSRVNHDIEVLSDIPEQISTTLLKIWNYLGAINRNLNSYYPSADFNKSDDEVFEEWEDDAVFELWQADRNNFKSATLALVKQVRDMLIIINNRVSVLLSGRLPHLPKNIAMNGECDLGLARIPDLLGSIVVKSSLGQNWSLGMDGADGNLLVTMLSDLLDDMKTALLVERYVHIYISERIPDVNKAMAIMRVKSGVEQRDKINQSFSKGLPSPITDAGILAYFSDYSYSAIKTPQDGIFHESSINQLITQSVNLEDLVAESVEVTDNNFTIFDIPKAPFIVSHASKVSPEALEKAMAVVSKIRARRSKEKEDAESSDLYTNEALLSVSEFSFNINDNDTTQLPERNFLVPDYEDTINALARIPTEDVEAIFEHNSHGLINMESDADDSPDGRVSLDDIVRANQDNIISINDIRSPHVVNPISAADIEDMKIHELIDAKKENIVSFSDVDATRNFIQRTILNREGALVDIAVYTDDAYDDEHPLVDTIEPILGSKGSVVEAIEPTLDTIEPTIDAIEPSLDAKGSVVDAIEPTIDTKDENGPIATEINNVAPNEQKTVKKNRMEKIMKNWLSGK